MSSSGVQRPLSLSDLPRSRSYKGQVRDRLKAQQKELFIILCLLFNSAGRLFACAVVVPEVNNTGLGLRTGVQS